MRRRTLSALPLTPEPSSSTAEAARSSAAMTVGAPGSAPSRWRAAATPKDRVSNDRASTRSGRIVEAPRSSRSSTSSASYGSRRRFSVSST